MATATEPKQADAPAYVDFDEFIDYQLTRTRSGIKSTDLLTALIGGAAAVLAYVLVFALFDHWVIDGGFSATARLALLSLLLLGLSGWAIWKLVLPYFRNVTPLYAAKQIEQTQPDLKNSLLTLVDLKRSGRPVPAAIETALERRSALNLSHMDIEEAVDRRLLMRLSYVLFVLVVLTCAYVLFSPKKLSNSLWRALLPASEVSVATRTRIDDVSPGDAEVLARAQLQVTADLSGQIPGDVTLLFTTTDRRFVDEPVAMRQTDDGLQRFSGIITGENGAGILQNLTYRITAGDAHSDSYLVTVKQPPSATVQDVTYEYPSYMGLDNHTQPGGAIDAWEGTWVSVRARANMPLKSAMVLFSDSEDTSQKAEEFPAELANGVDITARWQLRIRSDGTHPAFYRIVCQNDAGETEVDPTLHPVKIRPDLPPRIELAQPTGDIERPANAIVPLLYAAEDQDFLLRSIVLHLELNGETLPQQPRLFQAPPFRKSLHDVHHLELESLELAAGDRLTYWLEARDNMEPFADRSGNRTNTPKLNITINEAASPQEVQQQLEDDQQQIAERLEDARQEPGRDPREQPHEMSNDSALPPPDEDSASQPQDDPQPTESTDATERSTGQQAGGGDEQKLEGGAGQSGTAEKSGGRDTADDSDQTARQEQSGRDGESESPPDGEESFDDLLKKLMQRHEQQQQNPGGEKPPTDAQRQPSAENAQQPEADGRPSPGTSQSGQSESPQQAQNSESQPGESAGEQSSSPSSRPGDVGPGSPGDASSGSPEAMDSQPGSDPGTGSPPGATPDSATPKPGDATGGTSTPDPNATPPAGDRPANDGTSAGGQKQPGNDASGARPGDGNRDTEGAQPPPDRGPAPDPLSNQPGPEPGSATRQPDAKGGGQPDGPDEPMQGAGDPQGQRTDQPQTGEGGSSQQTSQGNKGGDQQGPGDSTGQPGGQESAGQKSQQPGDSQTGAGSQQQSGGNKSGGDPTSGSQQPGGESSPQNMPGTDPSSPAGGEQSQQQPNSRDGDPDSSQESSRSEQGGGEQGGAEQGGKSGGEQSGGESSSEPAGGPQSGGESGGAGQPGEGQGGGQSGGPSQPGGQAGSPPTNGSPGAAGSGTRSDGGKIGPTSPDGQGGGGEGEAVPGEGTAGEGTSGGITPEQADLEARKKAANLVLERLQDQLQRGEIDPDLQDDLNLTPERLRQFTDKLQQRLAETSGEDTSPDAQARRRQFEETLRTIDFNSTGTTREGGDEPREAAGGFAGPTRQAPPQLRDAARLYRERMQRRQRSAQ